MFTIDGGVFLRTMFWCRRETIAWFLAGEKGLKRNVLIYFIISSCVYCVLFR